MGNRYRNGWWLAQKYHGEGLTQAEIAGECGVSPRAIRDWMDRRGVETREVAGENHGLYGESRDEHVRDQISASLEGREMDEEWRERIAAAQRGRRLPENVRTKIAESLTGIERPAATRRRMSEAQSGKQNPRWNGGCDDNYGPGWNQARAAVRERDGVCQHCGHDGARDRLEVHHIVPLERYRQDKDASLRAAHRLGNLVLLCSRCHGLAEGGNIDTNPGLEPGDGTTGQDRSE